MNITIDWENLKNADGFYDTFLPQVSAPDWHGRNLNALSDSIVTGDVNGLEPPYTIINKNIKTTVATLEDFQKAVFAIFTEAIEEKREIKVINQ
jgi:RNAse (barnase) inhibitor barstar